MVMNQFLFECTLERVRVDMARHIAEAPYMKPRSLAEFEDLLLVIIFCSRCEDGGQGQVKMGVNWRAVDKLSESDAKQLAPKFWPYVQDMLTPPVQSPETMLTEFLC
jgi:hypothetical protein